MRRSLAVGAGLCSACLLFCGTAVASNALGVGSECDAVPDNIVANCGFETGDFRPEWTAEFGAVVRGAAHSGNFGMALDSQDPRDEACVSQTLATVPGQTYDLSYWSQTEGDGEFTALWDGLIIDSAWTGTPWHQRAWLVCGHGTDTLTFCTFPLRLFDYVDEQLDDVVVAPRTAETSGPTRWHCP